MEDLEKVEAPMAPEAQSSDEAALDAAPAAEKKKNNLLDGKAFRWYVIQAFSGFEQRVALTLAERIKIHHMEDYFGEILVPKEKVKEIKDGKKRESERKFFPGYVLVHMRMTSESWQQRIHHVQRPCSKLAREFVLSMVHSRTSLVLLRRLTMRRTA